MSEEIPDVPELPDEILEAAKNDKLVIFVGTGPSISIGAADWNGFANNVLDQLIEKKVIDHSFKDQIKEFNPRKKLSMAKILANEEEIKIDYEKAVLPDENTKSKIYEYLNSIGSYFVTTNYDSYLDSPLSNPFEIKDENQNDEITERNIISKPNNINEKAFSKKNTVVHLHGSFRDGFDNLVITTEDYLEYYKKPHVQKFLEMLFRGEYTILFIGYGLEELEILEYIISKSEQAKSDDKQLKRFWLQGCYNYQKRIYEQLKKYYSENFEIQMELYSLDRSGYFILERIIAKWASKINSTITPSTEKVKFVNKVIGDG